MKSKIKKTRTAETLKGEETFLTSNLDQSTPVKKGCFLIASSSSKRDLGSFCKTPCKNDLAFSDIQSSG